MERFCRQCGKALARKRCEPEDNFQRRVTCSRACLLLQAAESRKHARRAAGQKRRRQREHIERLARQANQE